ncbi:MAG: DUF1735 domain-containing protein [Prolixibacteraceae bacterium]
MKKFLAFIVISIALASCYGDYLTDYTFSGVYFPYQNDVRTFVVGEGMKIEVGVTIGGIRENTKDRIVNFALDGSLITPAMLARFKAAANGYIKDPVAPVTAFSQLPSNYYTISNSNTMVIKSGDHMGSVVIKPDSTIFLSDPATKFANYVLPFNITKADADSILEPKRYAVIGLRYDNMLFGKYFHGGVAIVNRPAKSDTTIRYYTAIPMPEPKIWTLTTNTPNSLFAPGYLDQVTGNNEMLLTLNGTDVTVSSSAGSKYVITSDGACVFNRPKLLQDRKIFLKYKYTDPGNGWTYHCTDTLTFRNRLRDGINEWQDENPAHYN